MAAIQPKYITDSLGKTVVQLPIEDWNSFQHKFQKYEQLVKLKRNLTASFREIKQMKIGKLPKKTLSDALNEL